MYEKLPFSYIRYQTYTENARNMNSKLRWQKVLGSSEEWLFPRGQGARSDHTAAGQGPLQLGSKWGSRAGLSGAHRGSPRLGTSPRLWWQGTTLSKVKPRSQSAGWIDFCLVNIESYFFCISFLLLSYLCWCWYVYDYSPSPCCCLFCGEKLLVQNLFKGKAGFELWNGGVPKMLLFVIGKLGNN